MAVTTAKDFLQGEVDLKLAKAKEITDDAAKTGRNLSDEEKAVIEKMLDDVTGLKSRLAEMEQNEALVRKMDELRGPVVPGTEDAKSNARSLGAAFVASDGFRAVKNAGFGGAWHTGEVEFKGWVPRGFKATTEESTSDIMIPQYQPSIVPIPQWPIAVSDLFGQGTATSSSVKYIRETVATNAAAVVTEGSDKPESTLTFETDTVDMDKLATFLPVSDEMLEDVQQIMSYIDSRLSLFVQQAEESRELSTLLGTSGVQTANASALESTMLSAVFVAITAVRVGGLLEPDGIVMNPSDWSSFRLEQDANKQYYGGGPFTGAYGNPGGLAGPNLWGLPVALSTRVAQGTVVVGAFKQGATLWRRSGITVSASNSHSDFFVKNLTAIRAESRVGLAVYRPQAFFKITNIEAIS